MGKKIKGEFALFSWLFLSKSVGFWACRTAGKIWGIAGEWGFVSGLSFFYRVLNLLFRRLIHEAGGGFILGIVGNVGVMGYSILINILIGFGVSGGKKS